MADQQKQANRKRQERQAFVVDYQAELPPHLALIAEEIRVEIVRLATEKPREAV